MENEQKSNFRMINVGEKPATHRRAIAQGKIHMGRDAFRMIKEKRIPKGDVLALGEVAGVLAAKRTSDLIPLCHPLPVDHVGVRCELDESNATVIVSCEVSATAKTGVEMEALSGVSGALLAIYDLTKAVDAALWISDIHLQIKEGGKSGRWTHPKYPLESRETVSSRHEPTLGGITAAFITISDRVSRGRADDASGPAIHQYFVDRGAAIQGHKVVPDEVDKIRSAFKDFAQQGVRLVISTGGTGLSPRDVTPEALSGICDRMVPGIGEMLRSKGAAFTAMAALSRSVAGLIGETLVIALPGSTKAVKEGLTILDEVLPHTLHITSGGDHARKG